MKKQLKKIEPQVTSIALAENTERKMPGMRYDKGFNNMDVMIPLNGKGTITITIDLGDASKEAFVKGIKDSVDKHAAEAWKLAQQSNRFKEVGVSEENLKEGILEAARRYEKLHSIYSKK